MTFKRNCCLTKHNFRSEYNPILDFCIKNIASEIFKTKNWGTIFKNHKIKAIELTAYIMSTAACLFTNLIKVARFLEHTSWTALKYIMQLYGF